jgi:amino-acid N-acetyltransferase
LSTAPFVRWLRDTSPYINAHRGKIFVISFGGETVADGLFANLAHDFALLHSLGVRLVLVHGIRPQVEHRLTEQGATLRYHRGLRVTDTAALACVKEAAGAVRVEIEALLSMGLANSPMAGARIRVASGNFVVAKPLGVQDGVDFGHTGEVRRIDSEGIRSQLDAGNVVLLSPIGYSPTGEVFNLSAEEIATSTAVTLGAHKLILLMEQALHGADGGALVQQITTEEAEAAMAAMDSQVPEAVRPHLRAACLACEAGVERAHLLDRHIDGSLLQELFTRDGVGTLVSQTPYETMRAATSHDVAGILELIRPLEDSGILVPRSRERLETDIDDYFVTERDGLIVACAALHAYPEAGMGELACLAVQTGYRGAKRGARLLEHIEERARHQGMRQLFALTTRTSHWFRERGYVPLSIDAMPPERQQTYSPGRNSMVLAKTLGAAAETVGL